MLAINCVIIADESHGRMAIKICQRDARYSESACKFPTENRKPIEKRNCRVINREEKREIYKRRKFIY